MKDGQTSTMAFTPDIKTMSRNVYLQRRLSVQCEFLDKEKQAFKRRYEEKQKECLSLLKSLQTDSKRYGLPVSNFSFRPDSGSLGDFRERSKSVCTGFAKGAVPEGPHRRRASSHGQADLKRGYVKDMKVYTFEKLDYDTPDTEAYTVYCHNPTRRVSSGTPVSRLNSLVPAAFSNYNSEIKWNDVRKISHNYMNRSARRDTLVDIRTPIVLADVGQVSPSDIKQRSYSYSGPSRGIHTAPSWGNGRQRSATVSGAYSWRNKRGQPQTTQDGETGPRYGITDPQISTGIGELNPEPPMNGHLGFSADDQTTGTTSGTDHVSSQEVCVTEVEDAKTQESQIPIASDEPQRLKQGRNSLSLNKTSIRRVSAPGNMGYDNSTVARTSQEARMQRRLSQVRKPCTWAEEGDDNSDSSGSEDCDSQVYDASDYVQRQVSSFMSNLKCSDALEDRVNSYLSSVKKAKQPEIKETVKSTKDSSTELSKRGDDFEKLDQVKKTIKPAKFKQTADKVLTQTKLAGLLRRPQMQLQMLLNKIRDANRAVERADRLKPKTRPKCTF